MRDPVKTTPTDPVRDPMSNPARDTARNPKSGGMSRWLWIGAAVLVGLILVMWLFGGMGADETVEVEPAANLPAAEVVEDPAVDTVPLQPATEAEVAPAESESGAEVEVVPSTPPE